MRGRVATVRVRTRALRADVEARVWAPARGELPLLVVHDGPEYERRTRLTRWARAKIAGGGFPPFRIALPHPGPREEWYSAWAPTARGLGKRVRPGLPSAGPPVGMGASLGAL